MPNNETSALQVASLGPCSVRLVDQLNAGELSTLAARFGVEIVLTNKDEAIAGSYWGGSEAGLIENRLYVRADTPVHSALHELCHYVCMPPATRANLDTNAGGDYGEENGVCFLQILLADQLSCVTRSRMLQDMDAWGYTFRLGSAQAWFEQDAEDARAWLTGYQLIDSSTQPTWKLREHE